MILVLIGTKAQLIKMAPIMLELDRKNVAYHFVLTGQHKETMSDLIYEFKLKQPDYNLLTAEEADTKNKILIWLLKLSKYLMFKSFKIRQGCYKACLVHGDTLSTLMGALISKRNSIPVIHIEAGLRSFSYRNPFPEEIVRVLVTHLSQMLFCPDTKSYNNVVCHKKKKIYLSGNSHIDSVKFVYDKLEPNLNNKAYLVASIHRFENISSSKNIRKVMNILSSLSEHLIIKFVLHPATKKSLDRFNIDLASFDNIEFIERIPFKQFIQLTSNSLALITDGGSNQEECAYLNIPCVLLRSHTERKDGLDNNVLLSNYSLTKINLFLQSIDREVSTREINQKAGLSPSKFIVAKIIKHYL